MVLKLKCVKIQPCENNLNHSEEVKKNCWNGRKEREEGEESRKKDPEGWQIAVNVKEVLTLAWQKVCVSPFDDNKKAHGKGVVAHRYKSWEASIERLISHGNCWRSSPLCLPHNFIMKYNIRKTAKEFWNTILLRIDSLRTVGRFTCRLEEPRSGWLCRCPWQVWSVHTCCPRGVQRCTPGKDKDLVTHPSFRVWLCAVPALLTRKTSHPPTIQGTALCCPCSTDM